MNKRTDDFLKFCLDIGLIHVSFSNSNWEPSIMIKPKIKTTERKKKNPHETHNLTFTMEHVSGNTFFFFLPHRFCNCPLCDSACSALFYRQFSRAKDHASVPWSVLAGEMPDKSRSKWFGCRISAPRAARFLFCTGECSDFLVFIAVVISQFALSLENAIL